MPPHCDSMDGPVVTAARKALAAGRPEPALPFVPPESEGEVRKAFELALAVRGGDDDARLLADLYFFETLVRLHRQGEGAAYTGLKPAGLDVGPVIPVAERALETGSPEDLVRVLTDIVTDQVRKRHAHAMELKAGSNGDLRANREYVEAMLGLQVWSHSLYLAALATPHEQHHDHAH